MKNNTVSFRDHLNKKLSFAEFKEAYEAEKAKIQKELDDLKQTHKEAAEQYGSELCTNDMLNQEKNLEYKLTWYKKHVETISAEDYNKFVGIDEPIDTRTVIEIEDERYLKLIDDEVKKKK